MRVRAKDIDWDSLSERVVRFAKRDQTFITPGKEYEVLAMSLYDGVWSVLICDDKSLASFTPLDLFAQVATDMPPEWICNTTMGEGVEIVLGPSFIAKDSESYAEMVDFMPDAEEELWKFYNILRKRAADS